MDVGDVGKADDCGEEENGAGYVLEECVGFAQAGERKLLFECNFGFVVRDRLPWRLCLRID